jgi:DNA-binding NarL/FixJ family response regulator
MSLEAPGRSYDRSVEAFRATDDDYTAQELTPREREVLQLVAMGAANKRIALELGMSEHTVKFHLASVFRKLGVTNRTQAAARYLDPLAAPSPERTRIWT